MLGGRRGGREEERTGDAGRRQAARGDGGEREVLKEQWGGEGSVRGSTVDENPHWNYLLGQKVDGVWSGMVW